MTTTYDGTISPDAMMEDLCDLHKRCTSYMKSKNMSLAELATTDFYRDAFSGGGQDEVFRWCRNVLVLRKLKRIPEDKNTGTLIIVTPCKEFASKYGCGEMHLLDVTADGAE